LWTSSIRCCPTRGGRLDTPCPCMDTWSSETRLVAYSLRRLPPVPDTNRAGRKRLSYLRWAELQCPTPKRREPWKELRLPRQKRRFRSGSILSWVSTRPTVPPTRCRHVPEPHSQSSSLG
jgi:hypothetical protein